MDNISRMLDEKSEHYRGIPFWSWNDRLDPSELKHQIEEMKKSGLGGFFMHARGGLETPYLSEEWFECISECINKAQEIGMQAWIYDEEGWPSGFAGGRVTALGYEHHMKWLEFSTDQLPLNDERFLLQKCETGNNQLFVYICSNRYYIDILNEDTVKKFLDCTHEEYYRRFGYDFGKAVSGFFTDEPQYATGRFPYTLQFEKLFIQEYGYSFIEKIIALHVNIDGGEKVRFDYWTLVSRLYCNNFGKQISDWCRQHKCQLTGHVMNEDTLTSQMQATGGAMPFYEYMDIPGIDWLGRGISNATIPKQVASVAAQIGKKQVISETFALCGWDVSLDELKWIAEWQFVNGINMICAHLQGYSLRGMRKRDYPPSLFVQQSWWGKYKIFNDYFSRLGALLSESIDETDVLLLHPIQSAYLVYGLNHKKMQDLEVSFSNIIEALSAAQIDYHFGDETILKKYASVQNGILKVGEMCYNTVLLPYMMTITNTTFELLSNFQAQGGRIMTADKLPVMIDGLPSGRVVDLKLKIIRFASKKELVAATKSVQHNGIIVSEDGLACNVILSTRRSYNGRQIYYLLNTDRTKSHMVMVSTPFHTSRFEIYCLETMKSEPLSFQDGNFELLFRPAQSYVVIETEKAVAKVPCEKIDTRLGEAFNIVSMSDNALTLDICDYKIDDGGWVFNVPVIILQKLLLERQHICNVTMNFSVCTEYIPDRIYLVVECPQRKKIKVNGFSVDFKKADIHFVDKSFVPVEVSRFMIKGTNSILIEETFYQNQSVYDVLFGENIHETEKNKLTFDTELESVYLVGQFGVYSKTNYEALPREAIRTDGPFLIKKPPKTLKSCSFTEQGLCFFTGELRINQTIVVRKEPGKINILKLDKPNSPVCELFINGQWVKTLAWASFDTDITEYVVNGENNIEMILYASNRNLLGPHHYKEGESYSVAPSTFTDRGGWFEGHCNSIWDESYCFVKFGISCSD